MGGRINCCCGGCVIASGGIEELPANTDRVLSSVEINSMLFGATLVDETIKGFPDGNGEFLWLKFLDALGEPVAKFKIGVRVTKELVPEDICNDVNESSLIRACLYVEDVDVGYVQEGYVAKGYFEGDLLCYKADFNYILGDVPIPPGPYAFIFPDVKIREGVIEFGLGPVSGYEVLSSDERREFRQYGAFNYDLTGTQMVIESPSDTDLGLWSYERLSSTSLCSGSTINVDCAINNTCDVVDPWVSLAYLVQYSGDGSLPGNNQKHIWDGCTVAFQDGTQCESDCDSQYITNVQALLAKRTWQNNDQTSSVEVEALDIKSVMPEAWDLAGKTTQTKVTIDVSGPYQFTTTNIDFSFDFDLIDAVKGDRVLRLDETKIGFDALWQQVAPFSPWDYVGQRTIPTFATLPPAADVSSFANVMSNEVGSVGAYYFKHGPTYYEFPVGGSNYTPLLDAPEWTPTPVEFGIAAELFVAGQWASGLPVAQEQTITGNVYPPIYCPDKCDDVPEALAATFDQGTQLFGPELNAAMTRNIIQSGDWEFAGGFDVIVPPSGEGICSTNPAFPPTGTEPWDGIQAQDTGLDSPPDGTHVNLFIHTQTLNWYAIEMIEAATLPVIDINETVKYRRKWFPCWSGTDGPDVSWGGGDRVDTGQTELNVLDRVSWVFTGFTFDAVNQWAITVNTTYHARTYDLSTFTIQATQLQDYQR